MYEGLIDRLQTAQTLAEFVAEDAGKTPSTIYGEAADAIMELLRPRWKEIAKEPPAINQTVIAIDEESEDYMLLARVKNEDPEDEAEYMWEDESGCWYPLDEYTHWLPLPAPPGRS